MSPLAALAVVAVVALPPKDAGEPLWFPPPPTLGPVETYGTRVQRTMHLLATSTPQKRNTVRILFYGQSITAGEWWKPVVADLRKRYPHANIIAENRAIGGYMAEFLVKTAEADLYPFYPDLLVFHVYGSPTDYESIVRRVRERTTADVLIQTDHLCDFVKDRVDEETDPAKVFRRPLDTECFPWRDAVFLPKVADRYGAELADVRGAWKAYLRHYELPVKTLTADGLHPNDHGEFLRAEVVKAHLRHHPAADPAGWQGRVKTHAVGRDLAWKDGTLALDFDGNRIDLVCKPGTAPPAAVRIDGKKPSEFPELYANTRAALDMSPQVASVLQVKNVTPRVLESWTLTPTGEDGAAYKFRVSGSVTGDDGEGRSDQRFVSKSGRVVIEAGDHNISYARYRANNKSKTLAVRWKVVPLFADEFVSPGVADPAVETVVTVAQGLPAGKHRLEVRGGPDTLIAAVRVYRPDPPPPLPYIAPPLK